MAEWKTIESAPEGGGDLLLFDGTIFIGSRFAGYWIKNGEGLDHDFGPPPAYPTHWHPLPSPPAPEGDR